MAGLHKHGYGSRNMTPLLKTSGFRVWSGETKGSSEAMYFDFRNTGGRYKYYRKYYDNWRAFAVRSGKYADIHKQAQSVINKPLSYLEILELQKSDLERVSDLFNVKGWNINEGKNYTLFTHVTNDNYHFGYNFNYGDGYDLYDIIYTMKRWSNASGEQIELLQKSDHSNLIIYYTTSSQFYKLESEAKKNNYKLFATKSKDDGGRESFYRNGNMEIQFKKIIWISTDGHNKKTHTTYVVVFLDISDINQIKAGLCSNCKGKGYISKWTKGGKQIKETCPICNGSGKNK